MITSFFARSAAALMLATAITAPAAAATFKDAAAPVQHVLLISIDGFHALDLANISKAMPTSNIGKLAAGGAVYTGAKTPLPSDSFPGLMALVTGGTEKSTGIIYDVAYAADLAEAGSDCKKLGAEVAYDESIDKNPDARDAGGGIDVAKLPLDPAKGCTPVYPHQYIRTNTIFEVVKAAGGRTAWSDKHPAYDIVNGPSGTGVDDLFSPEINGEGGTDSVANTEAYDDSKVAALLNEIAGHDHTGAGSFPAPVVLGMNFQAVSVAEKSATGGYKDGAGTPGAELGDAFAHTDASIGKLLAALAAAKIDGNTLVVLTAKHGQSAIDPAKRKIVNGKDLEKFVGAAAPGGVAYVVEDDVAYVFLKDHKDAPVVARALEGKKADFAISKVVYGDELHQYFNDAATDAHAPDLWIQPVDGVIYTKPTAKKLAEHGGGAEDDRHVALIVSGPGVKAGVKDDAVLTTQVAPTILSALGLDPSSLNSVKAEGTKVLPGSGF